MLKQTVKSILNFFELDLQRATRIRSKLSRQLRKLVTAALRLARYIGLTQRPSHKLLESCACPMCGSQETKYLFSQKELFAYSNVDNDLVFDLVRCVDCSMIYVNPRLQENVVLEIYKHDLIESCKHGKSRHMEKGVLFDAYHAKLDQRKMHYSKIAEAISRRVTNGKILEIGSSFGYFLEECEKFGYQAYGIEPSEMCGNFAREALGLRNVATATWEEDPFPIVFDVVCMLSVIEHLYSPSGCLRYIDSRLRPGGYLWLSCPLLKSELLWPDAHPVEHVNYFTEETLKRIVKHTVDFEFVELVNDNVFIFRKPNR